MQQLLGARTLQPALPAGAAATAAPACRHPTRPVQLRHLGAWGEQCVELLVATAASTGSPCCILPNSRPGIQSRGLLGLVSLDGLNASTVVDRLAAVEGHVATACSACPSRQQRGQPSPLVYSPEFGCFLERCLELAQTHRGLGLAPPVLLLQIVSRLNYSADDSLRASFGRYFLHLQVELETAAELHSGAISPQVVLAAYQAWADLGCAPMNSRPFSLALSRHLKTGAFGGHELARLLGAMAALRVARPSYRPSQYDVGDLVGALLASNLRQLAAPHLASLATSLGAFPWPVYQCVVPLLEAVAEEAVRRQAVGEMSPAAGAALLGAALASARQLSPRLGADLEAQAAGWAAAARLCSGGAVLPAFVRDYPAAASAQEVAAFM